MTFEEALVIYRACHGEGSCETCPLWEENTVEVGDLMDLHYRACDLLQLLDDALNTAEATSPSGDGKIHGS